jgi:Fe-S cluster biogenesis protein NfuA
MDTTADLSSDSLDGVTITGAGPEHDRRVRDVVDLIDVIRPAVEADGGTLFLRGVDTDAGVVKVELAGACGSCAVASMTLEGGITRIMRQRLDWVTEVQGTVDDDPSATGVGGWTPRT